MQLEEVQLPSLHRIRFGSMKKVKRFNTIKIRLEYIQEDSKSFGLELTTFFLNRFFKENYTTLNYTLHYITQHYVKL